MHEDTDERQAIIHQWIHAIPPARVVTYGQIAALAGYPGNARLVGRILARLPMGTKLPWHRVINAQGRISHPHKARQQELLVAEGVILVNGRVNLKHYQWQP
ncbi:MAG: MGMT family protein [Gammaproteobacteria bacterium]|nr:MGMT family protein [Gammaproteobacteria bacterium]